MLEDKDRIFKNLYNDKGSDIDSSLLRDDWKNTKEILSKGREWIINEIKLSDLRGSSDYRADLAVGLVKRLLLSLSNQKLNLEVTRVQ